MKRKKSAGNREPAEEVESKSRWKLSSEEAATIRHLIAQQPAINASAEKAAKELATHVRIRS